MIIEERIAAEKNRMTAAAFTAWQLGAGGKEGTFKAYLRRMGLAEDENAQEMTAEQKAEATRRGIEIAKKITAAVKADKIARADDGA